METGFYRLGSVDPRWIVKNRQGIPRIILRIDIGVHGYGHGDPDFRNRLPCSTLKGMSIHSCMRLLRPFWICTGPSRLLKRLKSTTEAGTFLGDSMETDHPAL